MAKLAKADARVEYRTADPRDLGRRCGLCSMYRAGMSCTAVAGVISPVGVCNLWEAKRPAPQAR